MPTKQWRGLIRVVAGCMAVVVCLAMHSTVSGQGGGNNGGIGGNNFFGVVGGVSIDANGVVTSATQRLSAEQVHELRSALEAAGLGTGLKAGQRVISLRRIEALLRDAAADQTAVPLDAAYLGGLQKIESIVVAPEENDLLIVGQGDAWTVNDLGAVVGASNGLPVIHLQDLIVAMRSVDAANSGAGISVSIDPTAEGVQRLNEQMGQIQRFSPDMAPALEQAMGAQQISLTGVPATSRFAQVLVNADYKMKRLSMGLEPSPIEKFPSMMEMIQRRDAKFAQMAPRFWMECSYEPLAKSEDGLVWQIRGQGVKTLTEEQVFDRNGQKEKAGERNALAEKWAESMTERFAELAAAEPAFAELRNIMDLTVVAAIIRKHELLEAAEADLPNLMGTLTSVSVPEYAAPKTLAAQCSFVRTSASWVVSTSGGVLIDSWSVASSVAVDPKLSRASLDVSLPAGERIWAVAGTN